MEKIAQIITAVCEVYENDWMEMLHQKDSNRRRHLDIKILCYLSYEAILNKSTECTLQDLKKLLNCSVQLILQSHADVLLVKSKMRLGYFQIIAVEKILEQRQLKIDERKAILSQMGY